MPRPTPSFPQWNTDASNSSEPSAGLVATGYAQGAIPSSSHVNYRGRIIGQWGAHLQAELASIANNDQFADGGSTDDTILQALLSIGAWVFGSGANGSHTVSGSESLTADAQYTDLTVENGGVLNTNGSRLWVSGRLRVDAGGRIHNNGSDASGATGGAGGAGARLRGGGSGADSGSAALAVFPALGGSGGHGDTTNGGSAIYTDVYGAVGFDGATWGTHDGTNTTRVSIAGGGGGGAAAGGGGGGGGVVAIIARIVDMADSTAIIEANGGDAASEGGGGGGGYVSIAARAVLGNGTFRALGGAAGPGPGGNDGSAGTVSFFQL